MGPLVIIFGAAFVVAGVGSLFGRYVIAPLLSLVLDAPDDDEDPAAVPGGGIETPAVPEGPGTAAVREER